MRVQKITLEQVLCARDRRVEIQNKMLMKAVPAENYCLVCLTMNIAGEIKRTPMTRMLFDRGAAEFSALDPEVIDSRIIDEPAGTEAFWLVRGEPADVKTRLEAIEESFPAARLFDFDVLVRDEHAGTASKLSRAACRTCLVCGGPVAECARSRRHGLDTVRKATDELLMEYCADVLAEAAYSSLLDELYTTPKPGLVDLMSCGAHADMDVALFEKSAESLKPYFHDAALMGMGGCSMKELRTRGLDAEKEMFEATGGVNTHKGMIYSIGLLLAGTGQTLTEYGSGSAYDGSFADECIRRAAALAMEDAEAMLQKSAGEPSTNGGHVLKEYGAKGATWEAATGFPDAVYCANRLKYYESLSDRYTGRHDQSYRDSRAAGALAFCDIMAVLEDTNLLHRGGEAGLEFARKEAAEIRKLNDYDARIRALSELDSEMTAHNLSPGGSADMLALAFFINRLRAVPEHI